MRLLRARGRRPSRADRAAGDTTLTSEWFDPAALDGIAEMYASYHVEDLSYATVRDFVDSHEHLRPLAERQGDMKDVQRPWTVKAILATVPRGGRIVEIGGGEPYVADLLTRFGYEVWLVDPYDGSGNGPTDYERYRTECPRVRFVRTLFDDRVVGLEERSADCIYSISVLEHLDRAGLDGVFAGVRRFLKPEGRSIHAIDHALRGRGEAEEHTRLRYAVPGLGVRLTDLDRVLTELARDTETYYLSAESHNRWRQYLGLSYDEFPMRVCVSMQVATRASAL